MDVLVFACLCRFVLRGERVFAEQVVEHTLVPMYSTQDSVGCTLYKTSNNDAMLTAEEGTIKLAKMTLPLPADWSRSKIWMNQRRYPFKVSLMFGGTELCMRAVDEQTGVAVQTNVSYEQDAAQVAKTET